MNTGQHTQARPLLWREAVGSVLRRIRLRRRLRLVDVAERAGVSAQYLSEMERGMKDPSSEMLAATAGALDLGVGAVARLASEIMDRTRVAAGAGVRSGAGVARTEQVLVLTSGVDGAASSAGLASPGSATTLASAGSRAAFQLAA
ncbi:MAG: helix-turn-helix domain-containing protein [Galactobacter sp.]